MPLSLLLAAARQIGGGGGGLVRERERGAFGLRSENQTKSDKRKYSLKILYPLYSYFSLFPVYIIIIIKQIGILECPGLSIYIKRL